MSVLLAAVGGVVTALVTSRPSAGWWVALAVLTVVAALLQAAVTYREKSDLRRAAKVDATGSGSVAVGGSAKRIRTRVRGVDGSQQAPRATNGGVTAQGAGAVSVGGDVDSVATDVNGSQERNGR